MHVPCASVALKRSIITWDWLKLDTRLFQEIPVAVHGTKQINFSSEQKEAQEDIAKEKNKVLNINFEKINKKKSIQCEMYSSYFPSTALAIFKSVSVPFFIVSRHKNIYCTAMSKYHI